MNDNHDLITEEKKHVEQSKSFVLILIAILFLMIFAITSSFLLFFSFGGILDLTYFLPKLALFSGILSIIFSLLAWKNVVGKVLTIVTILSLAAMIVFGP